MSGTLWELLTSNPLLRMADHQLLLADQAERLVAFHRPDCLGGGKNHSLTVALACVQMGYKSATVDPLTRCQCDADHG